MRVLLSVWWLTLGVVCSAAPLPFADVTLPTRNYVNNGGFERGLDGWGHFSMLDSARGRHYEPWQGVAEESLVYPGDGGGQVISRRWLALQAGTEDIRALASLARLGGV